MNLGLKGQTILITGASRGIGRAIAEAFAGEGCRLCLAARDGDALLTLARQLRSIWGVEVTTHAIDLSAVGAVEELHERFPTVDVLINNAGATPRGDLLQVDENLWRSGWELKVFGYIAIANQNAATRMTFHSCMHA